MSQRANKSESIKTSGFSLVRDEAGTLYVTKIIYYKVYIVLCKRDSQQAGLGETALRTNNKCLIRKGGSSQTRSGLRVRKNLKIDDLQTCRRASPIKVFRL